MDDRELMQLILEKLVSIEQGQKNLEQGYKNLEQGYKNLEQGYKNLEQGQKNLEQGQENLIKEIQTNRQAILELKSEVEEIKHSLRYYDFKIVEHEKELFKMKS
ncbi:hypothetical protein [Robertmurraya sp.]|uniref:hypothetical protein n=1 Tax=Robertmurraya sp. TaxID=2837525 RepID=UPI003704168B